MNKFLSSKEISQPAFKTILRELSYYHIRNNGLLISWYYKLSGKACRFQGVGREWEYPWSIINSNFSSGQRVLDAGCGNSPLLFYLYKRGGVCCGMDKNFSSAIYKPSSYSKKREILLFIFRFRFLRFLVNFQYHEGLSYSSSSLGCRIHYINGDMSNMPYPASSFDRIYCNSVIEHMKEEEMLKVAAEFGRVLKPQGLLIVTIDCFDTGLLWRDFITASGLKLYGESDFTVPAGEDRPCQTVGFVLQKQ